MATGMTPIETQADGSILREPLTFVIDYEMYPREQPSAGLCYHCGENRMLTHNFKAVDYETYSAICRNCALKWVEWDKAARGRLIHKDEARVKVCPHCGEKLN